MGDHRRRAGAPPEPRLRSRLIKTTGVIASPRSPNGSGWRRSLRWRKGSIRRRCVPRLLSNLADRQVVLAAAAVQLGNANSTSSATCRWMKTKRILIGIYGQVSFIYEVTFLVRDRLELATSSSRRDRFRPRDSPNRQHPSGCWRWRTPPTFIARGCFLMGAPHGQEDEEEIEADSQCDSLFDVGVASRRRYRSNCGSWSSSVSTCFGPRAGGPATEPLNRADNLDHSSPQQMS